MAHRIVITTDDDQTVQDIENFMTTMYQRNIDVQHRVNMDVQETGDEVNPYEDQSQHEVIATGKGKDFPKESESKR